MEPFEVTPVEEATTKPRDSVPVYKQGQRVVFIDQQGSYSGVVCWSQKDGPPMVGIKAVSTSYSFCKAGLTIYL